MLKLQKFFVYYPSIRQQLPLDLQPVFWYYKSGQSTISISQNVVFIEQANKRLYPNYYIHQDICRQLQKEHAYLYEQSIKSIHNYGNHFLNVFRLLIKGNIGDKDHELNINTLKANAHIKKIIQLKQRGKVMTKTPQIIIDDKIEEKFGNRVAQYLQSNLEQVQKLIQTGLGLPISFMISKTNVGSPTWLKLIAKKRKAIHSDIIQCLQPGSNRKPICLQQFVYNNGYKLQHLFLRPYLRGCPTSLLIENDSFNLEQILKILSIIDFQGKIVLQNTQNFSANLTYLDETLQKCGYSKKKTGQIELINQYMIF